MAEQRIAAVRRFSRFYTGVIGALQEGLLHSRFSLAEARVLYELAHRDGVTASCLGRDLGLDPGYLSRILRGLTAQDLVARQAAADDRRQYRLDLTDAGRAAFTDLDTRSRQEADRLLGALPTPAQTEVVAAMARIETLLGRTPPGAWRLRDPLPGDIGWVIARHGAVYAEEYGFDARFEALVATVAGAFLAQHEPRYERCWIAERDGVNLGSIFLVRAGEAEAKLRLLLVEPQARGLGLGKALVETCISFARAAGYRRVTLWTNDILVAARGIYQAAGFRLVGGKPHAMFGPPMVGEDWELTL